MTSSSRPFFRSSKRSYYPRPYYRELLVNLYPFNYFPFDDLSPLPGGSTTGVDETALMQSIIPKWDIQHEAEDNAYNARWKEIRALVDFQGSASGIKHNNHSPVEPEDDATYRELFNSFIQVQITDPTPETPRRIVSEPEIFLPTARVSSEHLRTPVPTSSSSLFPTDTMLGGSVATDSAAAFGGQA